MPEPTCVFPCLHVHIQSVFSHELRCLWSVSFLRVAFHYLFEQRYIASAHDRWNDYSKTRSMDPTEDSSFLTIAYFGKKFADMESSFSALLQEKNIEVSSPKDKVTSLEDK